MSIKRQAVPLTGGVNLKDDPAALGEGQWQRLRNLSLRKPGIIGTRPSLTFARDVEPDSRHWDTRLFTTSPVVARPENWALYLRPIKFLFDPNFGELSMVAVTTDDFLAKNAISAVEETFPAGTYLFINLPQVMNNSGTSPILAVAPLGTANRPPSMFVFNGTTYVFTGGNLGLHLDPPEPSAYPDYINYVENDFGTGNLNFNPDGACVIRDRVLYYKGSNVYFSDRNEPLVVGYTGTTDADGNIVPSTANPVVGTNYSAEETRGIYLGGEELESITAAADLSTSADGSPVQSVVGVWTKNHMYMLLGEPLETTEGGDVRGSLQINRLNIQAGCVSQATVTRTPYGTFWLGSDDVWFMPFGSLPMRVGTLIRPLLEAQPPGLAWKAHAEYSDGFYRLALFSQNQGPQLADPCSTHMWLSLHGGAPQSAETAKWFGPQEFVQTDAPGLGGGRNGTPGTWAMARDLRGEGDGRLYALQSYIVHSADTRSVYGMSLCSFDTYAGADVTSPIYAISDPWQAATGYGEGDIFVPPPRVAVAPYVAPVWVCTASGISHATTEPDWLADTATGTLTDGTVVWQLKFWDGAQYPIPGWLPPLMQGANQIEPSLLSPEFTFGDMAVEKLLDGSEIVYATTGRTQVTHNSHAKQDSRSHILGMTNENVADNVTGSTTGDRVWQAKALTASPTKRFHGLTAMWECGQDAGYVITAGVNDTISVRRYLYSSALTTIPAGYYADITALVAAVCTAVSTTLGHTLTSSIAADGSLLRGRIGLKFASYTAVVDVAAPDARLANLLGFMGDSSIYAPSDGTYAWGTHSPAMALAPNLQLANVNLRYRSFNRRPT